MKSFLTVSHIFLAYVVVNGQALVIEPLQPTAKQAISFWYNPRPIFNDTTEITCVVYFSGIIKDEDQNFPIGNLVRLMRVDGKWFGKIDSVPSSATALVITFVDRLGNRDNNHGKGYWSPIYFNYQPKPGALSGIGDLLYGDWITEKSPFHIYLNPDSVKKFFLQDFYLHPQVKRYYMRQYLSTLKMNSQLEQENFRKELEDYSQLDSLKERDLQVLRQNYARLSDTLNANKYQQKILKEFPNGPWAAQSGSLKLLINIGSTTDFEKQKSLYQQFKRNYFKNYPDEFAARAMNARAAQILSYMVNHFVEEGNLDIWLREVDQLQNEFKCSAYNQAAWELLGIKGRTLVTDKNSSISEHPFFQNNFDAMEGSQIAELLATRAIDLWRLTIQESPRLWNEPPALTDFEVRQKRNKSLSEFLEILGISLLKQNRLEEAISPLSEAVRINGYEDSSINQTYIEALVKTGKYELATVEMEKIIRKGKSTLVIDNFYSGFDKERKLAIQQEMSMEIVKDMVRKKVITEKSPELTLHDISGKKINSSITLGKIVILDFWASWCPPCLEGLKSLDQVADKYKQDSDIVFLLVNEDNTKERALKVIDQCRNKTSFVFDHNRQMVKRLGVSGLPTQLIIDKKGFIKFRNVGLTTFNVQENTNALVAMIEILKDDQSSSKKK